MSDTNDFRPNSLSHLIGQDHVRQVVSTALDFAFQEQVPFPHSLALGPPGVGKTAMARVISQECASGFHECLASAISSPAEFYSVLMRAKDLDVVFIDELHVLDLFGALTTRMRAVVAGVTDGAVNWPEPAESKRTLGDVLHDVDDPRCECFPIDEKPWLRDHWAKQAAKGNGFISQKLTAATKSVQAITKRYFAGQGDNPVVCHPTQPETYRWLTIDEVKTIMGLPAGYDLGEAKTTAGEIMGQGVLVDVFRQIIESVAPRSKERRMRRTA